MDKELVKEAGKAEMETFKKHGVCEKVKVEECWRETGKGPVGVEWVDTNKSDEEKPEYRCRFVAKEIQRGQVGGLFCSQAPAGGEEDVVVLVVG